MKRKNRYRIENPNNTKNYLDSEHLKTNPFVVPDGYFEQLTNNIQSKISEPQKTYSINTILKPALITAVSVIFIFTAYLIFNNPKTIELSNIADANRSNLSNLDNFIYEDLEESSIINLIEEKSAINTEKAIKEKASSLLAQDSVTLSQDDIIEYLAYDDLSEISSLLPNTNY